MEFGAISNKQQYPCDVVFVEDLDEMVRDIFAGVMKPNLKRLVCNVPQHKIQHDWVRHLRILGDSDIFSLGHFFDLGFSRGFYQNADGTWLLAYICCGRRVA